MTHAMKKAGAFVKWLKTLPTAPLVKSAADAVRYLREVFNSRGFLGPRPNGSGKSCGPRGGHSRLAKHAAGRRGTR